jgi:hypothetical protein
MPRNGNFNAAIDSASEMRPRSHLHRIIAGHGDREIELGEHLDIGAVDEFSAHDLVPAIRVRVWKESDALASGACASNSRSITSIASAGVAAWIIGHPADVPDRIGDGVRTKEIVSKCS